MQSKEIIVNASLQTIPEIMDFVLCQSSALNNPKAAQQIQLAAEEIVVNVANYAYDGAPGPLHVAFWVDSDAHMATLRFEDEGKPFNPLLRDMPDLDVPVSEREIGGLGVMFIKKLTDSQQYERQGDKNILTITKVY